MACLEETRWGRPGGPTTYQNRLRGQIVDYPAHRESFVPQYAVFVRIRQDLRGGEVGVWVKKGVRRGWRGVGEG